MTAPSNESNGHGTNRQPLEGKVAAITGAGNGRATVLRLGRDGASVFISDIDPERLNDALQTLQDASIKADGGVFDASKADDAD